MTPEVPAFVVDASVGVKCLLEEEGSAAAEALLRIPDEQPEGTLHVPGLFFVECAAAIRRAVLRSRLPPSGASARAMRLCALSVSVYEDRELVATAVDLANAEGVSVYDAVYVALSDRTGAPLVTADRRLHERLRRTGHRVLGLWEFGG